MAVPVAAVYYQGAGGRTCSRCHEIAGAVERWEGSTHRSVSCASCHGGLWTLDPAFHLANVRRVWTHFTRTAAERIRLREADVGHMVERCRSCHEAEFADWEAGPHGVRYGEIFLNEDYNHKHLLADDCLRCHGMYHEGSIGDLAEPVDTRGPWKLRTPGLEDRPAIPCLACHQIHQHRRPSVPWQGGEDLEEPNPLASLALYDRNAERHVPLDRLPLPQMVHRQRKVTLSADPLIRLCYQCHAPLESRQIHSGDDRTCIGVHEGLSCLACHSRHGRDARSSCMRCHTKLSHHNLDVRSMDTTFRSAKSRHDIHTVACLSCHGEGGIESE